MDELELAWAAGFFDGEGYVGVVRDKRPGRTLKLNLYLEQVDRRPLDRFVAAVGCGRVIRRAARRAPNRQITHRIVLGHEKTTSTFMLLWPYLSEPKREQYLRARGEVDGQAKIA